MTINWKWEKYFSPEEVLSPQGLNYLDRNTVKLQGFALDFLYDFRHKLDHPLYINHKSKKTSNELKFRGYRTSKENKKLRPPGVDNSPHTQGIAFDVTCYELHLADFLVKAIRFGWKGIGIYPKENFLHLDLRTLLRDTQVLWNGNKKDSAITLNPIALNDTDAFLKKHLIKELDLPVSYL